MVTTLGKQKTSKIANRIHITFTIPAEERLRQIREYILKYSSISYNMEKKNQLSVTFKERKCFQIHALQRLKFI